MPAIHFRIEWPDGDVTRCYSPSTVVRRYFSEGAEMTVDQLREISRAALEHAGRRVEERFGFMCGSATSQLDEIQRLSAGWEGHERVRIGKVG